MRDSLIKAMKATADIKPVAVEVPHWGTVYIRAVTVAEIEDQSADTAAKDDRRRIARGCARVLCDADGKKIFDADNESDVELLASQPWRLLRKVLAAAEEEGDPGN